MTFINWGNLRVSKLTRTGDNVTAVEVTPELENKDFKGTTKVTWLAKHSEAPFVPTTCCYFDNIISKGDMSSEDDFKDYISKDTKVRLLSDRHHALPTPTSPSL